VFADGREWTTVGVMINAEREREKRRSGWSEEEGAIDEGAETTTTRFREGA